MKALKNIFAMQPKINTKFCYIMLFIPCYYQGSGITGYWKPIC